MPTNVEDNSDRAASARNRQTLPDALAIGERVRRATLAATALHLIEIRRDLIRDGEKRNGALRAGDIESAV